jgi:predicted nuclease of predicted toxin-antitoxin system
VIGVGLDSYPDLEPDDIRACFAYADVAILARAVSERRVPVTTDSDFATLALRHGAAHHGVIQLPDAPIESLRRLLQRLLAAHPGDELASAVVIAKGGSVRIFRVIHGGSG